ncbi:MAG: DUF4142 domain-containing protein, partial [Tistlia sp.]
MRGFATAATIGLLGALLAAPAAAQYGNPAGMTPGAPQEKPGVPAPDHPNATARLFARLAVAGGLAEVELGELATRQGGGEAVQGFAQRMVEEHSKANERLVGVAGEAGIPLPDAPDAEHQAQRARLEPLSGRDFDLAYMSGQVRDHIRTAQLLAWEIGSGQDADMQRFAADTLPAV